MDILDYFHSKIERSGDCWLWIGRFTTSDKHPIFAFDKVTYQANRFAWKTKYGKLPDSRIRRMCNTPTCVNPDHFMELDVASRFWRNVEKTDSCWNWIGYFDTNFYGLLSVEGVEKRGHRISWELHNGKIPDGLHILHTCDNSKCVNPDHLYLGTHQDNMKDRREREQYRTLPKGSHHPNSKLTEADVVEIRALRKVGVSRAEISQKLGVSFSCVKNALCHKHWKHVQRK